MPASTGVTQAGRSLPHPSPSPPGEPALPRGGEAGVVAEGRDLDFAGTGRLKQSGPLGNGRGYPVHAEDDLGHSRPPWAPSADAGGAAARRVGRNLVREGSQNGGGGGWGPLAHAAPGRLGEPAR